MKALLIGYGNSLRRDDGVGPYLAGQFQSGDSLDIITCLQLTPELAEPVSRASRVIFTDAHAGLPPGEIRIEPVAPSPSALIHQVDPGALLDWSLKLYGRAPEATIVGIGGESFELGEGLSPAVERAVQEAVCVIRNLLRDAR